jgi:ABC-type Fe3+/spermidine/putrescine transport system ATPase subunit
LIQVQKIRRAWGAFRMDVDLVAPKSEYMVILGPSGCGKSLLLGMIAGLYRPESGRILINQKDITSFPPERRGVGFIFQRSSLFPHLSLEDNIEFGLRAVSLPRAERQARVKEMVSTLGLENILDRPVAALSGGEAQRVAIARALALRPSVLLLDEPLSLVDHNARMELQDQLRRIQSASGLTALHVTHNREEARAVGKHCAVMLGGRIIQQGLLDEVLLKPRCLFVKHFLGLDEEVPLPMVECSKVCLAGTGRCDKIDPKAVS